MAKKKKKSEMTCNKPVASWRDGKSKAVKACSGGKEKLIHFGDPDMPIRSSNKAAKKSYCARSGGIKGANNKLSANYWSRKAWKC